MRFLLLCNHWHVTRTPCRTIGSHVDLLGGRHEWRRAVEAGAAGRADVPFDYAHDSLADIVNRYPGGPPDAVIVWEPGYTALPMGMESAPVPIAGCYSDWNLVMPGQAGMLPAFDYLFTDRRGVRVLQAMGFEHVGHWPMWGHDPDFSRLLPGVEKAWDIGMIGNLSPLVQRERAPWLARVAALADRYRVRIAGGIFGEEYTRLMNATKITFNRSIRGEANMRCFEAAACGSLLFCEEENEEIRDFFEDRKHCVLYNSENLEDLLAHYLEHDEERESIARAAHARVEEFSFPRSLNRLGDRLEELRLEPRAGRRLRSLPAGELRKREARQAALAAAVCGPERALYAAEEALERAPDDPAVLNDLAVLLTGVSLRLRLPDARAALLERAVACLEAAVERCPGSAFFRMNLGQLCADVGLERRALELAQGALALLEVALQASLPVSYVTTGQEVPEDLATACPQQLASLLLAEEK